MVKSEAPQGKAGKVKKKTEKHALPKAPRGKPARSPRPPQGKPASHPSAKQMAKAGAKTGAAPLSLAPLAIQLGMSPETNRVLKGLKASGAPSKLLLLVFLLMTHVGPSARVSSVEFFAGQCAYSRAAQADGRSAIMMDRELGGTAHDILHPLGFCNHILTALKVQSPASAMLGPVCSTWVWINRATSKRSLVRPLGRQDLPSVKEANMLVARVVALLFILGLGATWWTLEQPRNSLMTEHPCMRQFFKLHEVWKVSMNMGQFGAPTLKPSWLFSNLPIIDQIHLHKGVFKENYHPLVWTSKGPDGRKQVTGLTKDLKASQAYPPKFGRAMNAIFKNNKAAIAQAGKDKDMGCADVELCAADIFVADKIDKSCWQLARFDEAIQFLMS